MPQPPQDVDPLFEDLVQDRPPETVERALRNSPSNGGRAGWMASCGGPATRAPWRMSGGMASGSMGSGSIGGCGGRGASRGPGATGSGPPRGGAPGNCCAPRWPRV